VHAGGSDKQLVVLMKNGRIRQTTGGFDEKEVDLTNNGRI
jgi:hypothetical protein